MIRVGCSDSAVAESAGRNAMLSFFYTAVVHVVRFFFRGDKYLVSQS